MLSGVKRGIQNVVRLIGADIVKHRPPYSDGSRPVEVRPEFQGSSLSNLAIQKLIDDHAFESVLDVGCGQGEQCEIFLAHGKKVTAIDYGKSIYFEKNNRRIETIIGDFAVYPFEQQFDCVWASHVLEHQTNAGQFLKKIFDITKVGGVVCVTVPPLEHKMHGGHVSLWNGGLLLYNLVLAGFDCREARVRRYGYNISVIVKKTPANLPELAYDNGDIDRISPFLPSGLREGFNGDILCINW